MNAGEGCRAVASRCDAKAGHTHRLRTSYGSVNQRVSFRRRFVAPKPNSGEGGPHSAPTLHSARHFGTRHGAPSTRSSSTLSPCTPSAFFAAPAPAPGPEYRDAARALGALLASRGIRLILRRRSRRPDGLLADAVLDKGGDVVGVITDGLQAREVGHTGLRDLRVVATMHERKALMASLADAFVALPGGAGTLDEFFEAWTWTQLGIHRKPVGILNVAGYFDALLTFLGHAVDQRFIRDEHWSAVVVDADATRLIDGCRPPAPVRSDKWLDRRDPPRP